MPDFTEIFTPAGREFMKKYLPEDYSTATNGFFDTSETLPVSDKDAVEILMDRKDKKLAEATALNDMAEAILDKVVGDLARAENVMFYLPRLDSVWDTLKNSRVAAGRELKI